MPPRKPSLRAVKADETAPAEAPKAAKAAPKSVSDAVATGDQRDQLVAMRNRIAKAIDDPNIRGADLAALSRRLLEIGREIDVIDVAAKQEAAENVSVPDEKLDASSF